jgi:hypothetical protein
MQKTQGLKAMTHENQCSRLWQAKKVQGLKGNDL